MNIYRPQIVNTVEEGIWEDIDIIKLFINPEKAKEYLLPLIKEIKDNDAIYNNDNEDSNYQDDILNIHDYEIDIVVYELNEKTEELEFKSYINYDIETDSFKESK